MKTAPAYLVIAERRNRTRIVRVTQTWPALAPGEAVIRVALDLPPDFLDRPVHTITIDPEEITVAVVAELEEPEAVA